MKDLFNKCTLLAIHRKICISTQDLDECQIGKSQSTVLWRMYLCANTNISKKDLEFR